MAAYSIKQIAYTGRDNCLSPYPSEASTGKLYPENILGSGDATTKWGTYGRAPYQQIILNRKYESTSLEEEEIKDENFDTDAVYYLKLDIPRNSTYDLNFALLLIEDFGAAGDLDQMSYEFIRYIHVPKMEAASENSVVILYERPKFYREVNGERQYKNAQGVYWTAAQKKSETLKGPEFINENVQVAIAEEIPSENNQPQPELATADRLGKIYYVKNNVTEELSYWQVFKKGTDSYTWDMAGDMDGDGFVYTIGRTTAIMPHSWFYKDTPATLPYEFIFKTRNLDTSESSEVKRWLYLYLIPQAVDNDIAWLYENEKTKPVTQFYGRHIDLKNLSVECYKIQNLVDGITPKRIGIWGRSELMFTINGEELRIPPSGYYELQDFPINFLGVVAKDNRDQFTIDIQY